MNTISIITQNLNRNIQTLNSYYNENQADIYAFQEIPKTGPGRPFHTIFTLAPNSKYDEIQSNFVAQNIWDEAFPWIEFKGGYWMEKELEFDNEYILIINYHGSLRYDIQLRYVLLKRLLDSNLNNKPVILLGDFNASFNHQTQYATINTENDKFLR